MRKIIKEPNVVQFKMDLEHDFAILCTVSLDSKADRSGHYTITVAHSLPALAGIFRYKAIASTGFSFTEFRNDHDRPTFAGDWWQALEDMHYQGIVSDPDDWRHRILDHVDQSLYEAVKLLCPAKKAA